MKPVNVAEPQWQCPICGTNYRDDLAAAQACVDLGVPDGDGAAERVAVWDHHRRSLAVVALDAVKLTGPRSLRPGEPNGDAHILTYENGMPAASGVGYQPGTVIELHGDKPRVGTRKSYYSATDSLTRELNKTSGMRSNFGTYDTGLHPYPYRLREDGSSSRVWWGPVTPDVADAFATLLPDTWQRLRDRDARTTPIPSGYRGAGQLPRWTGWNVADRSHSAGFHAPSPGVDGIATAAVTHGFAEWDSVTISRWEFAYRDAIQAALSDLYARWVDGEPVSVPAVSIRLSITEPRFRTGQLPRLPGKRRVAALARWGVGYDAGDERWYHKVLDAVTDHLAATAVVPAAPVVPDAPTYTEFTSTISKKAARP